MKTTERMLTAMAGVAALAAVLFTMAGCGPAQAGTSLHPETSLPEATTSPPISRATSVPASPTSTEISSSNSTRFWNVDTVQEAEQITGYTVYTPGYIPDGFKVDKTIMVNTVGTGPNSFRVVMRRWAWTGDPTVYFTLTQSPKDLEPGNAQPAVVAGTTGERAEETIGGVPGVELGWQKSDAYFVLAGIMKSPLTEDMLDQIAKSIQTGP